MPRTKYPIFKCLHRSQKGFTLVELLIVIAILGIIAAVVVPNLSRFTERGYLEAANAELDSVNTAIMAYYMDNDMACPADIAALVTDGYLSGTPVNTYTLGEDGLACVVVTGVAVDRFVGKIKWNVTNNRWEPF